MRMRGSVAHQALYKFYSGLPKELGADRVEPDRVEDALAFLWRCLDDAVQGVRVELTDLQRRELRHGLWRDLEAFVREEAAADMPLVPRRFEVLFGSERSAPELQRGLELAEGITLSGKIDRIDVDPFSARGIVQDYKAGKYAHSAQQIESEKRLQIPLYMLVLRDLVGVEPLGGLYRPLSGERKARGLLRAEAREDGIPGFAKNDYLAEEEFWGKVEGARELAVRDRRAHTHGRRAARSEGRGLPDVVRALVDVPDQARMNLNPEQQAAVDARGLVFVSAGAGTGKTKVLVERFARAVCDEGVDVESILVITYTEKAAGELRSRIRAGLIERGRPDLARELDGAWISTIHGFCHRLLRSHPFAAGVDPRFRVLDESQGRGPARRGVRRGADGLLRRRRPGSAPVACGVRSGRPAADAHGRLRDAQVGRARARPGARRAREPRRRGRTSFAKRRAASRKTRRIRRRSARRQGRRSRYLEPDATADRLFDLGDLKLRGERAATYEEARKRRWSRRRSTSSPPPTAICCRSCSSASPPRTRRGRTASRRSTSRICSCARATSCATTTAIREREQLRFRSIMVDEFQDTNRLQCELIDLLSSGPGDHERFFVGDEFQSIYGFRHADVQVFRERREQAGAACCR